MTIRIEAIKAFTDNYIWAMHDDRHCVLVDPGEAPGALSFLQHRNLRLAGLLLTHHHADHIGGADEILGLHRAPVWGPPDPRMPGNIEQVREGDQVEIPEFELTFEVIETPGHTSSHIAFHGHDMLFCGDTLFSAGCGRLFEGTPAKCRIRSTNSQTCRTPLKYIAHTNTPPTIASSRCRWSLATLRCRHVTETLPNSDAMTGSRCRPGLVTKRRSIHSCARASRKSYGLPSSENRAAANPPKPFSASFDAGRMAPDSANTFVQSRQRQLEKSPSGLYPAIISFNRDKRILSSSSS